MNHSQRLYDLMPIVFAALISVSWPSASEAATVTLDWDAVTLNADSTPITDLSGYMLFHATTSFRRNAVFISTSQALSEASITKTSVASSTTTYTLLGLAPSTTFYFRLTAFDSSGNHSAFNLDSSGQPVEISVFTSNTVPPCDVNSNGSMDVVDVQLCVRQALLLDSCTADINLDSVCNVVDVQLVVQSALSGTCVTP